MMPPPASQQTSRRAPWAFWTALLAMLLAVQASAGAIRPATLAESGAVAAKLTLPAPLAAQFRDTGHALKAAGQRFNAAKPHDDRNGAAPPLPSHALAIAPPTARSEAHHAASGVAPSGVGTVGLYRARAPPHRA